MGNPAAPSGDAVVFVNKEAANLERLFLSLHSLRRHWEGAVAVYHWGEVDHSLAITCARYRVSLHNVGEGFFTQFGRAKDLVWEATEVSPYIRVLYVPAGTLFFGDPAALFLEGKSEVGGIAMLNPHVCVREGASVKRMAVDFAEATLPPGNAKPCLVVCGGKAEQWDDAIWEAWCENEAAMTSALACPVRVPADAVVVTIVDADTLHDFERNWPAWKFTTEAAVCIVLDGVSESDIWLADGRKADVVVRPPGDLGKLEEVLVSKTVLCLAPEASPMPGANLLVAARGQGTQVYLHSPASDSRSEEQWKKTNGRIPLFAIAEANVFLRAFKNGLRERSPNLTLAGKIQRSLVEEKSVKRFDAGRLGWKFPSATVQKQLDPVLVRSPLDARHGD